MPDRFSSHAIFGGPSVSASGIFANVKDYGAAGDGVADDGGPIANACADVAARGGGVVYMPAGEYRTSVSVEPLSGVAIMGEGASGVAVIGGHPIAGTLVTFIGAGAWIDKAAGAAHAFAMANLAIQFSGLASGAIRFGRRTNAWSPGGYSDRMSFSNITIVGPGANSTNTFGMSLTQVAESAFSNISIYECEAPYIFDRTTANHYTRLRAGNFVYGPTWEDRDAPGGLQESVSFFDILGPSADVAATPAAPPAPVATLVAGAGSVDAGTHSYKVAYLNLGGTTVASAKSNVVTTDVAHAQVSVTAAASPDISVTAVRFFRSTAGDAGPWYEVGTVWANGGTFVDDLLDFVASQFPQAPATSNIHPYGLKFDAQNIWLDHVFLETANALVTAKAFIWFTSHGRVVSLDAVYFAPSNGNPTAAVVFDKGSVRNVVAAAQAGATLNNFDVGETSPGSLGNNLHQFVACDSNVLNAISGSPYIGVFGNSASEGVVALGPYISSGSPTAAPPSPQLLLAAAGGVADIHTTAAADIRILNSAYTLVNVRINDGGDLTVRRKLSAAAINVVLPSFANNAAAVAGGLIAGDFYRTGGDPDIVAAVH